MQKLIQTPNTITPLIKPNCIPDNKTLKTIRS